MNIVELREECSIRPHFTSIGVLFAYQTREFLSWKQGYDHQDALTTIFPLSTFCDIDRAFDKKARHGNVFFMAAFG